jgi:FMN phosphatase YigB (HAD superfamily)
MNSLILLDLDLTLVHSYPHVVPGFDVFEVDRGLYAHFRPYVREFIQTLMDGPVPFGFWTAGTREYAENIISYLFRMCGHDRDWQSLVRVVYTREDMQANRFGMYVKDLCEAKRKLGVDHLLLFDDNDLHRTLESNLKHLITVPAFRVDLPDARRDSFLQGFVRGMATVAERVAPRAVRPAA